METADTDGFVGERASRAVEYFMKGYGCAQSVAAAFADLYGLSEEQAVRIGAGFGGGVGRMRMMCGAVSGMVILAGLDKGNVRPGDTDAKGNCYKLVQELVEAFRQENGSVICAELLGLEKPDGAAGSKGSFHTGNFQPAERTGEYYRTRPCAAKVESAARIFAKYFTEKAALPATE